MAKYDMLHLTSMEDERLNSPDTSMIQFEAFGELLQISQDPNSKHLGTTVWDASMVLVKFLERNSRKGQFHPSKLKGKRAVELGAGCGLAGFGMALLGCDVVATDQVEVLPILMKNVERNVSRIKQSISDNPYSASLGSVEVSELDWGNQQQIEALNPPFDFIVGTDIVYAEHLLEPLLETILRLSGPKTIVLIGYELRSSIVHEQMNSLWKKNFDTKRIPKSKMDPKYQHSSIELFLMRPKCKIAISSTKDENIFLPTHTLEDIPTNFDNTQELANTSDSSSQVEESTEDLIDNLKSDHDRGSEVYPNDHLPSIIRKTDDPWQLRRYGSLAARLLENVKIPQ